MRSKCLSQKKSHMKMTYGKCSGQRIPSPRDFKHNLTVEDRPMNRHYWGSLRLHFKASSLSVFINDVDIGLESIPSNFADKTRLGGATDPFESGEALQSDLDKLEGWVLGSG